MNPEIVKSRLRKYGLYTSTMSDLNERFTNAFSEINIFNLKTNDFNMTGFTLVLCDIACRYVKFPKRNIKVYVYPKTNAARF